MKDLVGPNGEPHLILKDKIRRAIESALPESVLSQMEQQSAELRAAHMAGEMGFAELQEQLKVLHTSAGEIRFETLIEFKNALTLLLRDKKDVNDLLAHENDHMNAALVRGFRCEYGLQFSFGSEGELRIRPYIDVISAPHGKSEDEQRQHLAEITAAPEFLSPSDEQILGHVRKDLTK